MITQDRAARRQPHAPELPPVWSRSEAGIFANNYITYTDLFKNID